MHISLSSESCRSRVHTGAILSVIVQCCGSLYTVIINHDDTQSDVDAAAEIVFVDDRKPESTM